MRGQGCEQTEKAMGGYSEQVAVCKPRSEASGDTDPDNTLILDFCLQK